MIARKGAVELSVGTIVILVIGMTMLVLGILLVRTIFSGATSSVEQIDEGVKKEINDLFSESDKKLVVRLPNNKAEVRKGEDYGIAFGVRNTDTGGTGAAQQFSYKVEATSIPSTCGIRAEAAANFIVVGRTGTLTIAPGSEPEADIIRFNVPDTAPLCIIRYTITVNRGGAGGAFYDSERFDVEIIGN